MKVIESKTAASPWHGSVLAVSYDIETQTATVYNTDPSRPGDGTPVREWHGIERVWDTYSGDTDDGRTHADPVDVIDYLTNAGRGAPLLARIEAGSGTRWDGSNLVGWLSEDARQAEAELQADLLEVGMLSVIDWTCDEWLDPVVHELRNCATEQDVRAMARTWADPNVLLDEDIEEYAVREWQRMTAQD